MGKKTDTREWSADIEELSTYEYDEIDMLAGHFDGQLSARNPDVS